MLGAPLPGPVAREQISAPSDLAHEGAQSQLGEHDRVTLDQLAASGLLTNASENFASISTSSRSAKKA